MMSEPTKVNGAAELPKRARKPRVEAIVVAAPTVRLGSVPITNPGEMVLKATEYANVLADIIIKQELFKVIQGRRYVLCEGWTTLGAMLGVVPVEESCEALPEGHGYVAKVSLIRTSDGQVIGGASAECTKDEPTWKSRSSYALRSMSITRATGKAFRLSFSWIMKLAGFEPTPAEEMNEDRGSKEAAQEVARQKIADHEAKTNPQQALTPALFYTWYDESQTARIEGDRNLMTANKDLLEPLWNAGIRAVVTNADQLEALKYELERRNVPFKLLKAVESMESQLKRSLANQAKKTSDAKSKGGGAPPEHREASASE
jgi:hypothetical protein